jgi:hypothetical protein
MILVPSPGTRDKCSDASISWYSGVLGEDVANLQLDLPARLVPTTFEPVTSNDNREAGRAVEEALKALIRGITPKLPDSRRESSARSCGP